MCPRHRGTGCATSSGHDKECPKAVHLTGRECDRRCLGESFPFSFSKEKTQSCKQSLKLFPVVCASFPPNRSKIVIQIQDVSR